MRADGFSGSQPIEARSDIWPWLRRHDAAASLARYGREDDEEAASWPGPNVALLPNPYSSVSTLHTAHSASVLALVPPLSRLMSTLPSNTAIDSHTAS